MTSSSVAATTIGSTRASSTVDGPEGLLDDLRALRRRVGRPSVHGREQHPEAPVWTILAPARAVLAVVPVAGHGGPDEYVVDPAEVDLGQATRVARDDLPRPLRRRGGLIDWTSV